MSPHIPSYVINIHEHYIVSKLLTFTTNTDITSSIVHAGTVLPLLSYWVVATYCVKNFKAIVSTNNVNEIIHGTQTMVS
jgi:hypothetical protein